MNQLVILAVVVLTVFMARSSALECYLCGSETDEKNVEHDSEGCADLKTTTTTTAYSYCSTTYISSSNGVSSIFRSGTNKNQTDSCINDGLGTTCYCTTDKCNSETVEVKTTFDCYECQSSDYFDNGCGQEIKETSEYVHKVTGCSACGKITYVGTNFVTKYSRGCARAVEVEDECFGEEISGSGKLCVCQDKLCNSAPALHFTAFSLLSALLLFVTKCYC